MARPISEEELQLKRRARRRLVGAIVLVTAVAVILPMVLDSEPRPVSQSVNIQIPSSDSDYKPKGAASVPSRTEKSAKAASEPAAKPDTGPIATIAEPPPPAAAKETGKAGDSKADKARDAKPAAKDSAKDTAASTGGFVVQVAALADSAKAKQLEQQIAGAGLKTYTEVVSTQAGDVTRVRAGPYPTREAAEKARTQLKKVGLDGKVVRRE